MNAKNVPVPAHLLADPLIARRLHDLQATQRQRAERLIEAEAEIRRLANADDFLADAPARRLALEAAQDEAVERSRQAILAGDLAGAIEAYLEVGGASKALHQLEAAVAARRGLHPDGGPQGTPLPIKFSDWVSDVVSAERGSRQRQTHMSVVASRRTSHEERVAEALQRLAGMPEGAQVRLVAEVSTQAEAARARARAAATRPANADD